MRLTAAIIQTFAAAIFVIGGIVFAWRSHPPAFVPPLLPVPVFLNPYNRTSTGLSPGAPEFIDGTAIPLLYLDPANAVMWSLMAAVWLAVIADAAGRWMKPISGIGHKGGGAIWPVFSTALIIATLSPWLFLDRGDRLLTATGIGMALAVWAARRARGRPRPAVGFLAGWTTALFSAALAGRLTDAYGLETQAVAALAILPGTAIGMAAQIWIGHSIGYSVALIWAFCAVAFTAMGSDPVIALAAILGISGMAAVLIRAAS